MGGAMASSVVEVAVGLAGLATVSTGAGMAAVRWAPRPYLPGSLAEDTHRQADPVGRAMRYGCAALEVAAHAEGRQVRVFGVPAGRRGAFWPELSSAGVDLIGSADLRALRRYPRGRRRPPALVPAPRMLDVPAGDRAGAVGSAGTP